jgi:peptidoglycan/LPS O-acetylase OafA/YrhL
MIFSHISALVRPPHILVRDIPGGKETFHSIDALRGIAALTVVIFHYKNFFRGTADQSVLLSQVKTTPLFSALAPVMEHGALAVMLFWLISGFVFMHVHAGRAREISARHYAVHRFSRLYPLHFATLMIVAVMQIVSMYAFDGWQIYQNQDLKHFVLQIFMASNWGLEDGHSFNGPIWSVSAEIAIYAAFFVFIIQLLFQNPKVLVGYDAEVV